MKYIINSWLKKKQEYRIVSLFYILNSIYLWNFFLKLGITNVQGPPGVRGPDGDRGYRGDRGQPGYLVCIYLNILEKKINEISFSLSLRVLMVYRDLKEKKVILVHLGHK